MKSNSLIVKLINYQYEIYNKMKFFLQVNNFDTNNSIINFTGHLIEDIFNEFFRLSEENQPIRKFVKLSITNNERFKINSIPKQFNFLSTSFNHIFLPNIKFNNINNFNVFKNNNAIQNNNIKINFLKYKIMPIISFNIIPPLNSIRNANIYGNNNFISTPLITRKVKFYKILKFNNKEDFLDIFENEIMDDEQITDYEIHVESFNKKTQFYYLLIEFNEVLKNPKYKKYEIIFIGMNKAAYIKFLNKKGPMVEPEEIF